MLAGGRGEHIIAENELAGSNGLPKILPVCDVDPGRTCRIAENVPVQVNSSDVAEKWLIFQNI